MGVELNTKLFLKDLASQGKFRNLRSVVELGSQDDKEQSDRAFECFVANQSFELEVLSGKVCCGGGALFYS